MWWYLLLLFNQTQTLAPHPLAFTNGGAPACAIARFPAYTAFLIYNGHGTLSLKVHYRWIGESSGDRNGSNGHGNSGDNGDNSGGSPPDGGDPDNLDPGDAEPPTPLEKMLAIFYVFSSVAWFYITLFSAWLGNWNSFWVCVGLGILAVIAIKIYAYFYNKRNK